jgi:glucose-6-phosphate 1-dehydrogenase
VASFEGRLSYLSGSYDDPDLPTPGAAVAQLDAQVGTRGNRLYYLATPPALYPLIVEQLGRAGLNRSDPGWTRIIVENRLALT